MTNLLAGLAALALVQAGPAAVPGPAAPATPSVPPLSPSVPAATAVIAPAPQAVLLLPPADTRPADPRQVLPASTPVQLMVLKEVNSRINKPGDRFVLRVDAPVSVNGQVLVPVGANAWGEVVSVKAQGAVGKSGRLGARLLYLELPTGPLPLTGTIASKGADNGAGVALAVVGFGILGLLNKGDSARLKGGDVVTGYVADVAATSPAATAPDGG